MYLNDKAADLAYVLGFISDRSKDKLNKAELQIVSIIEDRFNEVIKNNPDNLSKCN